MAYTNEKTPDNTADVLIGGKVYRLSGGDPEHLHRVAALLNRKISETRTMPGYRNLDQAYRELLLNINLADEYFRAVSEAEQYKREAAEKENELYTARHDLVGLRLKLENALKQEEILEKRISEWKEKYAELEKLLE